MSRGKPIPTEPGWDAAVAESVQKGAASLPACTCNLYGAPYCPQHGGPDAIQLPELDIDPEGPLPEEILALVKETEEAHIRPHIRIQQRVNPERLEIIRDMLLDGNDLDAISILCLELGLIPKPKRHCVWGVRSADYIPTGRRWSFECRPHLDRRWRPRTLALSRDCAAAFEIAWVADLAAKQVILGIKQDGTGDKVSGEFFARYRGSFFEWKFVNLQDKPGLYDTAIPIQWSPVNDYHAIGVELPFAEAWGPEEGGGVSIGLVNRADGPVRFEGVIVGDYLDEEI